MGKFFGWVVVFVALGCIGAMAMMVLQLVFHNQRVLMFAFIVIMAMFCATVVFVTERIDARVLKLEKTVQELVESKQNGVIP